MTAPKVYKQIELHPIASKSIVLVQDDQHVILSVDQVRQISEALTKMASDMIAQKHIAASKAGL